MKKLQLLVMDNEKNRKQISDFQNEFDKNNVEIIFIQEVDFYKSIEKNKEHVQICAGKSL